MTTNEVQLSAEQIAVLRKEIAAVVQPPQVPAMPVEVRDEDWSALGLLLMMEYGGSLVCDRERDRREVKEEEEPQPLLPEEPRE